MPYIGTTPTKVVSRQSANVYRYTATAGQSVFTGADLDNNVLACNPADMIVHMNGLRLESTDYTATSASVTLTTAATAGDEVTVTSFVTFEVADTYTKTAADDRYVNVTGDTMTGRLIAKDTINVDTSFPFGIQNGSQDPWYLRSLTTSNAFAVHRNGLGDVISLDSAGRVTMPYQPAFSAYGTGTLSWTSGSYVSKIVPLIYTQNNIGGHFSTSTYRFTAPVTGSYYFSAKATQTGSATGPSLIFTKNGAAFGYEASIGYYTAYHSFTGSTVMHLNANDYVSIYIGNNNSVAMNIDLGRSSFSGYLIG